MTVRSIIGALALAGALLAASGPAGAQDAPETIRIGYVASLSGPFSPGTMTTTVPNYRLWVKDVNDAGGLMLSKYGKRIPIELIELDDRSNIEDAVRLTERLMTADEVDLVLAPWGTGTNLAVAPIYHKYGYPLLAVTAVNGMIPELTQRWPNVFFYLGMPAEASEALVGMLEELRAAGRINDKVALMAVSEQFGAELVGPGRDALTAAGFDIVYDASYPADVKDMTPQIKAIQAESPDTLIAFSYPGDTFLLVETAHVNGFTPKVFYTAVGTAFPAFKQKFGDTAEGHFGIGGWDPSVPGAQDYFDRHVAVTGQEPDRWASPLTYASLQMLQQAIEKVGEIDRERITEVLANDTFDTIVGPIKLEGNRLVPQWWVGQWQDGDFKGVAPASMHNAVPPIVE
jgi:branched-chain amino acid transport system substrate-binding protein